MQNVILLNNLFNGDYVKKNIGGEIINIYQSDNNKYYIYINPYGNIEKKWDNRIKHVLFIRSVGNQIVKIIGKAKIKEQINCNAVFSKKDQNNITKEQEEYINKNNISYGGVKLSTLGSWSKFFLTFQATSIYKSKLDIYLAPKNNNLNFKNITILKNITRINNQSQKLYIEPIDENYNNLLNIINNADLWEEKPVDKVNSQKDNLIAKSFLSIIKKENDELVNSNLLAYFLENDQDFWSAFVEKVLEINIKEIKNNTPKITRETIGNIDLFIEVDKYAIVIENKIKSRINGVKKNDYSQLEKYIKEANEYCKESNKYIYYYILRPNYNNENYQKYDRRRMYKEIKYSKIYEIIKSCKKDLYFEEFKKVIKKHSKEYNNELFELMDARFLTQIKTELVRSFQKGNTYINIINKIKNKVSKILLKRFSL